jgi:hypothetical protein
MSRSRFIVLLTLSLAGCSAGTDPQAADGMGAVVREAPAPPTVISEWVTGLTTPAQGLITTEAEWKRLWNAVYRTRQPQPAPPIIDFSDQALVFYAPGSVVNGAEPVITGARLLQRGTIVQVTVTTPSRNCLILTVVAQPVHVVRIPKPGARAVRFERTDVTRECR